MEAYSMPEWSFTTRKLVENSPTEKNTLQFTFKPNVDSPKFYLRKYIEDKVALRQDRLKLSQYLCLHVKKAPEGLKAGFITSDGYTYVASCPSPESDIIRIPLNSLQQTETALLPTAYPVFMKKYFNPVTVIPFRIESIESLELSFDGEKQKVCEIEIGSIWIE